MTDTPGDDRTLRGGDSDAHHVDVPRAEAIFNELSRSLTQRSELGASHAYSGKDIEKGGLETIDEGRFDLREYLQSSNDAHQEAGFQHKHVGVTWENLQVEVVGGGDHKVRPSRSSSYDRHLMRRV